jgi:uncharacterized protein
MNKFYSWKILGITVVIFILQTFLGNIVTSNFMLVQSQALTKPWMFVSAIFLHGSLAHLMFNMFGLFIFGVILEQVLSSRRFLWVYFGTGIIANIIGVFFYPASLGASGAIMGILGCLAVMRPNMIIYLWFIPMKMWVAVFVWLAMDTLGFFGVGMGNIANITHIAGLLTGLAFGYYFRKKPHQDNSFRKINEWHYEYMKNRR